MFVFPSTTNNKNCYNPILVFQYIPIRAHGTQSYEGDRIDAH